LKSAPKLFVILLFLFLPALLLNPWQSTAPARAEGQPAPNLVIRQNTQTVKVTWYDWWMVHWENNQAVCRITVEHTGLPYSGEILNACGTQYYNEWKATQPCQNVADSTGCHGMYLHFLRSYSGQRNVDVTLPDPQVWLSLVDCDPDPTPNICTKVPTLLLTGEEPLPNEMIIRIQGTLDGEPFSCPGNICSLPLKPTGTQGISIEFWGDSSHGDSTDRFTALVRIMPHGDSMAPEASSQGANARWNVDIISSQWRDGTLASCADTWQVFPDSNGPPPWLNTPIHLEDMLSTHSYYYLAGVLIENQVVDASACPNGGLGSADVANECGLNAALPAVKDWQNRFDNSIFQVSKDTGVPAQLLKNVFGRESQFWPGFYSSINEVGLGQLTDKGADTLLLWNPDFYNSFCKTVLSSSTCQNGFIFLTTDQQNMLTGALLTKVNASCPQCPLHIDPEQAAFSVRIFAESMLATCQQTGRIIFNITQQTPGQVSTYVDMWKFTLANYNAGPGCLYNAAKLAYVPGQSLTWDKVKNNLEPACQPAVDYVAAISQGQPAVPTPTPWVFGGTPLPAPVYPTAPPYQSPTPTTFAATSTPQPTAMPTSTLQNTPTTGPSPTAGPSPTPTATQEGYPIVTATLGPTATQGTYP
jgi:hypothetical protein